MYPKLNDAERRDAIQTLVSRPHYALAMLEAMGRKEIPSGDLSAFGARGLLRFKNAHIEQKLNEVWGAVRQTSKQKTALMAKYKSLLTPEAMKRADLQAGHATFKKICGQCHKLFGEGGEVGPDLTGSQRANLDYLLENALDPNALIGSAYKLTNVVTDDGRLISGIVLRETDQVLTLRTVNETIVLRKDDIDTRAGSNVSMMPEGIFEKMRPEEIRNLVSWLRLKSPPSAGGDASSR